MSHSGCVAMHVSSETLEAGKHSGQSGLLLSAAGTSCTSSAQTPLLAFEHCGPVLLPVIFSARPWSNLLGLQDEAEVLQRST